MIENNETSIGILIAEDSPTQAEQLRYLLEDRGYRVRVARNGRLALNAVKEERPSLVISDVMMPELDGFGLCRELKADKVLAEIPVILLTSLSSPNDVISGLESGADFFLRKPYDEGHLISRVHHVLSNRALRGSRVRGDLEVVLAGQRHSIHSGRQQILDLLISTYEEAIRINEELVGTNRQLELRNSEVERASRFKDQFLSMMSHELRTPLNAVLGFSELLADPQYGPLNDRQKRYVNHIHTGGKHLLRLINDILDLSRIEAGRLQLALEDVSVHLSFAEVSGALQSLIDQKHLLLTQSASPHLIARADGTRFRQILMNLLGNAIKFTPEGGKIELAAHPHGTFIRIEVRDTGPGIPYEEQERIFEAFHRSKVHDKTVEGTGLGLAIARSLVELHGGTLGLDSEPALGSCFYFTLPMAVAPVKADNAASEQSCLPPDEVTIMVIEDDPATAELIESQLSSAGYRVVVCQDPQRAVETAVELQPSAITLDIVMRPIDGWQILHGLKKDSRSTRIPVFVLSITEQQAKGVLLGADEYIVKPIDRSILLSAIERNLSHPRSEAGVDVLVVEDHAPTRECLTEILSSEGYSIRTAADGERAREEIEQSLPGIVILDLILPTVNGMELIAEWRSNSRTAGVPIFVLTGKDLTVEEREYLHANTLALFQKRDGALDSIVEQIKRVIPPPAADRP